MNFTPEEIKELQEMVGVYLEMAEVVKPVAEDIIKSILQYGPVLRKLFDAIIDYQNERTIATIKQFKEAGLELHNDQILALVLGNKMNFADVLKNINFQK
jgi:hypothetical protein